MPTEPPSQVPRHDMPMLGNVDVPPEFMDDESVQPPTGISGTSNLTMTGIEDGNHTASDLDERIRFHQHLELTKAECLAKPLFAVNGTMGSWCPLIWDRLVCWDSAAPNTTVFLPCPKYVKEFNHKASAWRRCGADGRWESQPNSDLASNETDRFSHIGWTNYSACLNAKDFTLEEWLPTIKQMSVVGYSVSLATLIISFIILASLRKLRCPRNLLHLHLFASFMLRAGVVLLRSSLFTAENSLPPNFLQRGLHPYGDDSSEVWSCKLLISVWQYFILANYSWLLMEGLYLHSLIFMALFTDSSAITLYILLGWGLPLGCVCLWVTLRATLDDSHCWTVNYVQWIFWVCIRAPVAISNLINFFFFLNIIRVLVLKLRSSVSAESMKYRKLGKSTLVLVPLFGVHYFVLWGLSTSTNVKVELAWLLLDQVFASFQGFFVAVLYCLMNGEVRQELRKLYNRWYKGDPLVLTTHSTQVSNTKTYASGRTSIHSIYSQAERRDRSTPSPQMPRSGYPDGGTPSRPRTASPSPTATLTPSYGSGSRQQSKETNVGQGSSENCEETIELQPRLPSPKKNAASINGHNSSNATVLSQLGAGEPNFESVDEGTTVEILIDFTDGTTGCKKGILNDALEETDPEKKISFATVSQNGQVHGKSRDKQEKHLTFSESTENRLNYKAACDAEEKRCLLADAGDGEGDGEGEDGKGVVCVNVSKKSLKSTSPLLVESTLVKKSTKREQETML
ncbi:secretin receptor-like isoform X2 [Macrobrachium rosenbergii]|uniref:secretin receptor-like isoform X2 n=1 Tax=Macrobrachium rosenbergii TaxID=79674 RepID=UPI0034D548FE